MQPAQVHFLVQGADHDRPVRLHHEKEAIGPAPRQIGPADFSENELVGSRIRGDALSRLSRGCEEALTQTRPPALVVIRRVLELLDRGMRELNPLSTR
jgi:hypothetical protein